MTDHDRHDSHDRRLEVLEVAQREIVNKLDEIKDFLTTRVGVLDIELASLKGRQCPEPGACQRLAPAILDLQHRMTTLEAWKNQAIGAMQSGKLVGGAVWGIVGAILTALFLKFFAGS